eukprot:scaffold11201_cov151-Cylindrotheca_fusiformis.AAC.3
MGSNKTTWILSFQASPVNLRSIEVRILATNTWVELPPPSTGTADQKENQLELEPTDTRNSHHLWNHNGQCTLRLVQYTLLNHPSPDKIPDGYWQAGPHTDWGNVTILIQRPSEEDLECHAHPRAEQHGMANQWISVPPIQGGIAVNIGDMLM